MKGYVFSGTRMALSNGNVTSVKIGGGILLQGFTSDFSTQIAITEDRVPILTDLILNRLLPSSAFDEGGTLTDMKGAVLLRSGWEDDGQQATDELFFVEGSLIQVPDEPDEEKEESRTFSLQLITSFKEFRGDHIVFSTSLNTDGTVFSILSPREIGRAAPLAIKRVRLGVDLFENTFIGALMGATPGVKYSLFLMIDAKTLSVKCHSRKLKKRDLDPFALHPLLSKVSEIVSQVVGVDLTEAYAAAYSSSGQ